MVIRTDSCKGTREPNGKGADLPRVLLFAVVVAVSGEKHAGISKSLHVNRISSTAPSSSDLQTKARTVAGPKKQRQRTRQE